MYSGVLNTRILMAILKISVSYLSKIHNVSKIYQHVLVGKFGFYPCPVPMWKYYSMNLAEKNWFHLVFHEKLMTTYIPIIHMLFHQCEHVRYCDQIWFSTTVWISKPIPLKLDNYNWKSKLYYAYGLYTKHHSHYMITEHHAKVY